MDDYISREAASDLLAMALIDEWEPEYAQDRLREVPAADVRPVVRGEWKHINNRCDGYAWQICSECGEKGKSTWNFCRNCGADMREEGSK